MILGTSLIAFVAGFFAILMQDIKLAYFTILIAILIAIYLVYSIRECWRALKRYAKDGKNIRRLYFNFADPYPLCKKKTK